MAQTAGRLVLWADARELAGPDSVTLFPDEACSKYRLSSGEISVLGRATPPLCSRLIAFTGQRLSEKFRIPQVAGVTLAREPVAVLAHLFLERLLRFSVVLQRHPPQTIVVGCPKPLSPYKDIQGVIVAAAASQNFNQSILSLLGDIWEVETLQGVPNRPSNIAESRPPPNTIQNHNFSRPHLWQRIHWKLARSSSRRFGSIPALGMAYATSDFLDSNFYGPGRLADLHASLLSTVSSANFALREELFSAISIDCQDEMDRFLQAAGMGDVPLQRTLQVFTRFLQHLYPLSLLEEIPEHLPKCIEKLKRFASRPLIFCQSGDPHTTYMLAAAKSLGMTTIGTQDGVQHGFLDTPTYTELLFPFCDQFITWGWRDFPENPLCGAIKAIPLPSPWLSQRRKAWKAWLAGSSREQVKPHDILLMTDKMQRYSATLATVRTFRPDYLGQIAKAVMAISIAASRANIRVLHKPFDDSARKALEKTIREIQILAGSNYQLYDKLDKGLTHALIEKCQMVVWDDPGTGFFECLVSGIPTLLYWPRMPFAEAAYAQVFFSDLESAGIVHREVGTLIRAITLFKASPQNWMENPSRLDAIERVCHQYAWVEDDWPRYWREFLKTSSGPR